MDLEEIRNKCIDYWVYVFKTPNNMYYVGYSGKKYTSQRWNPNAYSHNNDIQYYIEMYGWENFEKIVLVDGLTEEQALQWEDRLICMYTKLGCCLNKQRSGGNRTQQICDKENYERNRETILKQRTIYRKTHKEQINNYFQKLYQTPEHKIYFRVKNYNNKHPEQKLITAQEAKEMYLLTGYIPDFIKNNDLV